MITARRSRETTALIGALLLSAALLFLAQTGDVSRLLVRPSPDRVAVPSVPTSRWLALEDGTVVQQSTTGETVERIEAQTFGHLYAKTATQIGWDGRRALLWYSDSHTGIRSLSVDTHEPGPSLMSFSDAALVGCSTVSDGRPFAIDESHRRIFVPVGTGGILIYDADRLTLDATIPPSVLDSEQGFLPPLTVDEQHGTLWYGARDGSIVEVDLRRASTTGRRVAFAPSPHDVRSLAIHQWTLEVLGADGVITRYDLGDLHVLGTQRPPLDGLVVGLARGK